jgi:glycosyltransferase involved in cell wall biosynthesis/Tfp pilus assembly protein PilF
MGRYLFGPVAPAFADQNLRRQRSSGECLAFNAAGTADVLIGTSDTWEAVCSRFPPGWRPDYLVVQLAYACVPQCLWSAPLPIIGLATDCNLLWHYYRRVLRRCELVLTDPGTVEVMNREGLANARPANLHGCERFFLEMPGSERTRDIDILFVGNLHSAVQRERLPWLGRLAPLAEHHRVVIEGGLAPEAYRDHLRRARIVFNWNLPGRGSRRVFEAMAAGALVFIPSDNEALTADLRDREDCVHYDADNLATLVEYYLIHDDERRAIAETARAKADQFSFEHLWDSIVTAVESELPRAPERVAPPFQAAGDLLTHAWEFLNGTGNDDAGLIGELQTAANRNDGKALALGLLGLAQARSEQGKQPFRGLAMTAAEHFAEAIKSEPHSWTNQLNLIEALLAAGRNEEAADRALHTLEDLESSSGLGETDREMPHFPPGYDPFRVEWERAAWMYAGVPEAELKAKRDLLRWRLHILLAHLSGERSHAEAACELRPDLPVSQAFMGAALLRARRALEAVPYFRRAMAANPFDADAAKSLYAALSDIGHTSAQEELVVARRRISRMAPRLVPQEGWFARDVSEGAWTSTPVSRAASATVQTLGSKDFHRLFGRLDTSRAVHGFTNPTDTNVVLTLLAHTKPQRILEVGTAVGHMTANLTEWSAADAVIFTMGTVADLPIATSAPQRYESPDRATFARFANHFGKVDKVLFITADSLHYDFRRLAPLDFAFVDGAHDFQHVLSDSRKAYDSLRPGGCLVWHDFDSRTPWVEVRRALEQAGFPESIYHVAGTEVAFLYKVSRPAEPAKRESQTVTRSDMTSTITGPSPIQVRAPAEAFGIVWEGAVAAIHSLALVNREICRRLIAHGHDLTILPLDTPEDFQGSTLACPPTIRDRLNAPLTRCVDVHVRHAWPPEFKPPESGHWVIIQPWEFGSLPKQWIGPLAEQVDESWACSGFVRDCYVQSGVPAERVHVIPLGIDPLRFNPQAAPLPLPTSKRFKFLFVGGTIHRKGIDVLLDAFASTFRGTDDVCLVIKEMGRSTFYRGQTADQQIAALRAQPGAPEILYLEQPLSEEELAGLYTACDCLVHPFRGEGFGLPMVEAMASGLPVIATAYGPALEFCNEESAYLLPARVQHFAEKRIGHWETVDYPWLAEPDREALKRLLAQIVANPREARQKGAAASAHVRQHFTWDHTAVAIEDRVQALRLQPVRRFMERAPAGDRPVTASARKAQVNLTMIVKNEEKNLPDCLTSAADLMTRVVIVDTGSTDRTKEIAAKFGAKVHDFPWCDDFAAARNECLRYTTGDWNIWLDADDRIDEENRQRLRRIFAQLGEERDAYAVKVRSHMDDSKAVRLLDQVRIFPNHPNVRWEYRIHEQILPSVRRNGGNVRWTDITIDHVGYQDPTLRKQKLERNLRLLQIDAADRPDDAFTLFNLGWTTLDLGNTEEAMRLLRRSLERSSPDSSIIRKLYVLLTQGHRQLGHRIEALALSREGQRHCPDDLELPFEEAQLARDLGDFDSAERALVRLLELKPTQHFASVDPALRGWRTRHALASICFQKGRLADAESLCRAAVSERPDFVPAWLVLGDVCVAQSRWAEVEEIARRLREECREQIDSTILQARAALARREFETARRLLEEVIATVPKAIGPRVLLTHAFLQEGRDWIGAEVALRNVLELAPEHREARHNLEIFLRQQGREVAPNKLIVKT